MALEYVGYYITPHSQRNSRPNPIEYIGYYITPHSQTNSSPNPMVSPTDADSLRYSFLNPTATPFIPKTYFKLSAVFDGQWMNIPGQRNTM